MHVRQRCLTRVVSLGHKDDFVINLSALGYRPALSPRAAVTHEDKRRKPKLKKKTNINQQLSFNSVIISKHFKELLQPLFHKTGGNVKKQAKHCSQDDRRTSDGSTSSKALSPHSANQTKPYATRFKCLSQD